jgi:two-component system chemotaxis response regulator CheB
MDALDAGAFDYVQKPALSDLNQTSENLIAKIKAAALVDASRLVVGIKRQATRKKITKGVATTEVREFDSRKIANSLIAIGASTGGTEALKVVLMGLPKDIPPIFIVQHMPPVFTKSFAARLNELCPFNVKEAQDGEQVQPGTVYIAPGGIHMTVVGNGKELKIRLIDEPPENRFKPSVDFLFRSVGKIPGMKKTATLLTGMGNDGARELLNLRKQGVYTIAQDEETCVVFGMPKVAIEMGAVMDVMPLEEIAGRLTAPVEKVAA